MLAAAAAALGMCCHHAGAHVHSKSVHTFQVHQIHCKVLLSGPLRMLAVAAAALGMCCHRHLDRFHDNHP